MTRRIVLLGTGTGVGKTFVTSALVAALRARGRNAVAWKPIESGIVEAPRAERPPGTVSLAESDAALLARASETEAAHRYALPDPISPHLAARRAGVALDVDAVAAWLDERPSAELFLVETAGGAFSPLGLGVTNVELATRVTGPGDLWILVAPDSLGVLHDVTATLLALAARGRSPDWVVLSGAREADASTGENARELEDVVFPALARACPRNRVVHVWRRGATDCELFVSELLGRVDDDGPVT